MTNSEENKYLRWLTKETQTVYWNDNADMDDLDVAISNGAVGVTTNPFLISQTIQKNREFWKDLLSKVDRNLEGNDKVEAIISLVTSYVADKLSPLQGDLGSGFCCAQTDPTNSTDTDKMIEQAKKYAALRPNIVVKLPATRGGIKAYEECVALGYNVAATVSFTVPQVLAVGEAYQKGVERAKANGIKPGLGIAVLMVGRLDDYLRDVMNDSDNDASEEDIIWAGTAAIKRAYKIFQERNYDCILMPAGCRGAYHITEIAGAKMICSIAPGIAAKLQKVNKFEERIDKPVDPAIIKRLQSMPEFVKAYEPDGMKVEEFITFGSCNRTLTQFVESGWNQIKNYEL